MDLNFKRGGEGEPLVLIHGLFGSLENLGALARALSTQFTVYSLDLPNHGRSPHVDTMALATLADDVAAWMDAQGLRAAHFLGHSLGGKVAMELALSYPQRVRRLVVVDIAPVYYRPHHDDVFTGLLAIDTSALRSRSQADAQLRSHVPEVAIRSFLLKNLFKDQAGHFGWRINLPVIHRHYADILAANRSDAVFERPVLFIKGGDSDYLGERYRNEILSRFPAAQVRVVPQTGHWLHAEKPALVARLVQRFLQKEEDER